MRLAILSNVNMDILIKNLSKDNDIYRSEGYGNFVEEMINSSSGFNSFRPDLIFILLDGPELIKQYGNIEAAIESLNPAIDVARELNQESKIYLGNIDVHSYFKEYSNRNEDRFANYRWQEYILSLSSQNIEIFDLLMEIENLGRDEFYSTTYWYLSGTPYSDKGLKKISTEIRRIIKTYTEARKKCLVLDLDNTLWGGVVGEDGPLRIKCAPTGEGAVYYDFQRNLKKLKDLGIILCISSKNNLEDVEEVFLKNQNIFLSKEDFSVTKINWERKSQNIAEIAEELNIGLDSIVFIDDNPIEREEVLISLPEVIVPAFPSNIYNLNIFLKEIYEEYFFTIKVTDEDKKKTEQYSENIKRETVKSKFQSYEEYLDYLEIKIDIREVGDQDLERASQLTQKTNQFNLTTKRFTEAELNSLRKDETTKILIGSAKDRFGDYGKIILAMYRLNGNQITIDSFLMSCRAMGKNIEKIMLDRIEKEAREKGANEIIGLFRPTKKNKPAEEFYLSNGFVLISQSEEEVRFVKGLV